MNTSNTAPTSPIAPPIAMTTGSFFLLLGLHIPLGMLMRQWEFLATSHAIVVLLAGLFFLIRDQTPERVIRVAGYLMGAEVLWRMTSANVFWEYSKYAITLLFFFAILKYRIKLSFLPVAYMIVLIPSIFLLGGMGKSFAEIRSDISFNLSGPLCLMAAVLLFSRTEFRLRELSALLQTMLMPILSLAALVLIQIIRAESIMFTDDSNFLLSGGYGPNQVSAILGLGALLGWCYFIFNNRLSVFSKTIIYFISITLFFQSMLTYSRGGVFNLLIPLPLVTLAGISTNRRSTWSLFMGLVAVVLFVIFLFPKLDAWTGGTLSQRYTMVDTTGRAEIVEGQLQTFRENPIMGVGPGVSKYLAPTMDGRAVASHTEYSRLLAEHGLFGAVSMLLLAFMTIRILLRAHSNLERFLALGFAAWTFLDMSHAAMRISAVSFLFGLSQAHYKKDDP